MSHLERRNDMILQKNISLLSKILTPYSFAGGHRVPFPSASYRAPPVPEEAAHRRLAGDLPRHHAHVHGDDSLPVHHLSAHVCRRGEGEEDQGGYENHGPEGLRLLVGFEL
jgi:hypothetical protein